MEKGQSNHGAKWGQIMWIKLGNEYLNLDHIVRVRFNKGWKNGVEELVAEVEGFVKGDIQVFARYRNQDAAILHAVLGNRNLPVEVPQPVPAGSSVEVTAPFSPSQATRNTLHAL